jgi:hypothetical protein
VEEISLMKKFAFVLALSLVAAGTVIAEEPTILHPGPGGDPGGIDREVLWVDTPDFAGNAGSSEVIGDYDLISEIANDFILEVPATIEKMSWWGMYWNSYEEPTGAGFNLRYYYDAGCLPDVNPFLEYLLPGNDCCETLAEGGDMFSQFIYEYCATIEMGEGLWWFSAQMADHVFPPQWGRLAATMIQVCDSAFRSAFFAYPDWVPAQDVFGEGYDASQMFEDVCVPTATHEASWGAIKGLYR